MWLYNACFNFGYCCLARLAMWLMGLLLYVNYVDMESEIIEVKKVNPINYIHIIIYKRITYLNYYLPLFTEPSIM